MQRGINTKKPIDENPMFDASEKRFAIVVSGFNYDITFAMKDAAIETLIKYGAKQEDVDTIVVPGAFELPFGCLKLAKTGKYDGLVALGCVIKGGTDHYFYIAGEASRGIMEVMLRTEIPIGFGVITVNSVEQAEERSEGESNKGIEATVAMLQMIQAFPKETLSI